MIYLLDFCSCVYCNYLEYWLSCLIYVLMKLYILTYSSVLKYHLCLKRAIALILNLKENICFV